MKVRRLKIGNEFTYYGVKQKVYDIVPPKVLVNRIGGDNKIYEIDYLTLIQDPSFILDEEVIKSINKEKNNDIKRHISYLDSLPEEKREDVSKRYEMIKPILLYERIKDGDIVSRFIFADNFPDLLNENDTITDLSKEELYRRLVKKHNKSERQLQRYVASYKKEENELPNHGMDGLIQKYLLSKIVREGDRAIEICDPNDPNKVLDIIYTRKSEAQANVIKEAIERHYLKKRKISIAHLHEIIEILCYEKGINPIGYDTVYSIVKRLDSRIKDLARSGKKEDYLETSRGFANQFAMAPLHVVEIDHTPLDMDIIDEESGVNLGRPWITMGIDVFTRMIWCMHISFDDPSADKVRKAIQQGIFFKRIKEKYNTLNEWEISGIPKIIYFDNGKEFKNAAVKRIINETLESQVMYRPVATPRYGGVIERFFGTINKEFIHNQAGTRKSNPKDLGDYDAEKEAIFTLEDIRELLTTYIVDVYHHDIHKGLPLEYPTPTARYYQGIEAMGFPDFVSAVDEEYYKIELLPTDWRKYQKDGIRMGNVFYASQETFKYINKQKIKYKFKYDIDDISRIYLFDPDSKIYFEVPAINPPYEELVGMSKKTYKLIREELSNRGVITINSIPGSRDIVKGKALLKEKYEKMMKKNKKVRQKALKTGFSFAPTLIEKKSEVNGKPPSRLEMLKQKVNEEREKNRG